MSKLLSFRNAALACSLAVALPAGSWAQSPFSTSASDYLIAGSAPGDQTRPALAISPSGGYLVWQDNGIDGTGLGIAAVALNSSLSSFQPRFRINQRTGADQERPQVAIFPGGGAAFAWQSGYQGFQHIYARFLSPSNTWLGPDVRLNSGLGVFQANPAIATLTNGNVVVLWNSRNQFSSSSMDDIYAQILSPAGQKVLPAEVILNQFTSYNQRTPAVAALSSGGFVAVWVSEQERLVPTVVSNQFDNFMLSGQLGTAAALSHASIDVYARFFNANGSPAGDEFLVNDSYNICANPRVAVASDGSFMVAWSQKDRSNPTNSWDVYARRFPASSSSASGPAQLVNTTTYGDQFLPQISSVGANFFVAWSSLGQDGSSEGVYGQILANDGSPEGGEFRVNASPSRAIRLRMHPALASDNVNRFLAVWSSFIPGVNNIELAARAFAGTNSAAQTPGTVVYASPASDPFPIDPVPDPAPSIPTRNSFFTWGDHTLEYPVTLSLADTNAFAPFKGSFSGLFYETNGITPLTAGYFTALTTDRGSYSARITLGKRSYAFSGRLDNTGSASKVILRSGLASLKVQFQVVGDQILGTIQSGSWLADVIGNRQVPAAAKSAASSAQVGPYTFIIPPDTNSGVGPAGFSFGSLVVDSLGNLRWAGSLADGTKVAQKSAVSKDGVWPLYSSLYSGSGSLIGWVQFTTNQPAADMGGQVLWLKPRGAGGKSYFGGFTNEVWASGSRYTPPARGSSALNFLGGSGILALASSNLGLTNAVTVDAHNRVRSADGSKLTLTVTPANGLFRGTVLNPATGRSVPFQGALFQDSSAGFGFFLNSAQSGWTYLTPSP